MLDPHRRLHGHQSVNASLQTARAAVVVLCQSDGGQIGCGLTRGIAEREIEWARNIAGEQVFQQSHGLTFNQQMQQSVAISVLRGGFGAVLEHQP